MIQWMLGHLFVWAVRITVLVVACLSMQHLLTEELGYRMEFQPMLVGALLMIVTVRIWMPWQPQSKKSINDVSEP